MSDENNVDRWAAAVVGALVAERKRHREDIELLICERDEARAVLQEVEWAGPPLGAHRACPVCDEAESIGHRPDCALARALGERA